MPLQYIVYALLLFEFTFICVCTRTNTQPSINSWVTGNPTYLLFTGTTKQHIQSFTTIATPAAFVFAAAAFAVTAAALTAVTAAASVHGALRAAALHNASVPLFFTGLAVLDQIERGRRR